MLNYIFFLQIIIFLTIVCIYWVTDFIFLLIIGIIFLFTSVIIIFFIEVDALIGFLIIVDLGVFLVLLTFCVHLLKYLNTKYLFVNIVKNLIFIIIIFISILYFFYYILIWDANLDNTKIWYFFILFISYYTASSLIFLSEMHIFKDIYFNINSFEFVLVSVLLFISLFVLYRLYKILIKINFKIFNSKNITQLKLSKNNSMYFFKTQNNNKQYTVPASSRVFKKYKYDSKTNNSSNNR